MPKTMFEKIWEAHEVRGPEQEGGAVAALRRPAPGPRGHLRPGVRGPAAGRAARCAGRTARWRPPTTTSRPTRASAPASTRSATTCRASRSQALERNCAEFGVPLYGMRSRRQGIVHVIGPELGLSQPGHHDRVRRLAHLHARCARRAGDAGRHLRGRARARDPVPAAGRGRARCASPSRASPASASRRRT